MAQDLILDSKIMIWVLLPIALVMFLWDVLRFYATKSQSDKKPELKNIQEGQTLRRSALLRANGRYLQPQSFNSRRAHFTNKDTGVLVTLAPKTSGPPNPLENQEMMMDMMKSNMFKNILPNILLMGWVNFFFSGFLVGKMPFPLTPGFRKMLQRGVELADLEPTYISSLSWYFICMYGRKGLLSLCIGEGNDMDEAKMMQSQMQMMQSPQQADMGKVFAAEKESLDLANPTWIVDDAEKYLLKDFKRS